MKKTFCRIICVLAALLMLAGCGPRYKANSTNIPEGEYDMEKLDFNKADEIVYPYIDAVREYLEAGAKADVSKFDYKVTKQMQDVVLSWNCNLENVAGFELRLSKSDDMSDAQLFEIDKDSTQIGLKYLSKGTKYYAILTSKGADHYSCKTSFTVTDLGPRFLDVGGLYENCRDLGGYEVNGRRIVENMLIRGGSPDDCSAELKNVMSEEGRNFLENVVKVKTELDFRATNEIHDKSVASFKNAQYVDIPLNGYEKCFSEKELYLEAFRFFANKDNYPIYFHCVGGADRTGTVAALILALLGVDEDIIVQDYVVTTFTKVCSDQAPRARANIIPVIKGLNKFEGDTLSEKCASYLMSLGLTEEEITSIRAIMFGDK